MSMSTLPPKNPATSPRITLMTLATVTGSSAMISDTCPPQSNRLRMSRPCPSSPSRWPGRAERGQSLRVVTHGRIIGTQHGREQGGQAHETDERRRAEREAVLAERFPEDPPLRGPAEHPRLGRGIGRRGHAGGLFLDGHVHQAHRTLLRPGGSGGPGPRRRCRCRDSPARTRRWSPGPRPGPPAGPAPRSSCRSAARSPATRTPPP